MDESNTSEIGEEDDIGNPYGFSEQDYTFGVMKKGVYYPKSDFSLELIYFVSAKHHTGFVCQITRDIDKGSRYVYTEF